MTRRRVTVRGVNALVFATTSSATSNGKPGVTLRSDPIAAREHLSLDEARLVMKLDPEALYVECDGCDAMECIEPATDRCCEMALCLRHTSEHIASEHPGVAAFLRQHPRASVQECRDLRARMREGTVRTSRMSVIRKVGGLTISVFRLTDEERRGLTTNLDLPGACEAVCASCAQGDHGDTGAPCDADTDKPRPP